MLGPIFLLLSLPSGGYRRPRLPAGLHCRGSARHGHLRCRETPTGGRSGLRRRQRRRSALPLLLRAADGREPADRALQAEIAGGEESGQVSVLYLINRLS